MSTRTTKQIKLYSSLMLLSLGIACAPPPAAFADSILALGWVSCTVTDLSGTHIYTYPQQSLPQYGANAEVVDTNATKLTLSRTASRKGNSNPALKSELTKVECTVAYELRRSTPVSSPSDVVLRYSLVANTSLALTVEHSASGTKARGFAVTQDPRVVSGPKEITGIQTDNHSGGPTTVKTHKRFPYQAWETYGSGSRTFVGIVMPTIDVGVSAVSGGSGGNTTVAIATGIGIIKLYPSSFSTGTPTGIITGTINTPLDMCFVDIFSTSGTPLSFYGAPVDSSSGYEVLLDEGAGSYRAYFHAPGSLRKRIDINYDPSMGLSGVNVTLLYGDLNGDNYVSQAEADFVTNKIGLPAVSCSDSDAYDIRVADFDKDGEITSTDAAVAAANVGVSGD